MIKLAKSPTFALETSEQTGPSGFSTGQLSMPDFKARIKLLTALGATAIEFTPSYQELHLLPDILKSTSKEFVHVSVHSPTPENKEQELIDLLHPISRQGVDVIVHPDDMKDLSLWCSIGSRLCLENMDNQKTMGQTQNDLSPMFDLLPEAGFCLDLGHAYQIDRSMDLTLSLIKAFAPRLRQLHISQVTPTGPHTNIGPDAQKAYQTIARRLPKHLSVIIESFGLLQDTPECRRQFEEELSIVRTILNTNFEEQA